MVKCSHSGAQDSPQCCEAIRFHVEPLLKNMNMGETVKEKEYMNKYVLRPRRTTSKAIPSSCSKFVSKKNGGCSHGMITKAARSWLEEETDGPKSKKKSKLPPCCSWYTGKMKKEVDKWAKAEREEQDRLYPELEQQWRDREERIKQGLRRILARSKDKAKKEEEEMKMDEEKDKAKKEEEEIKMDEEKDKAKKEEEEMEMDEEKKEKREMVVEEEEEEKAATAEFFKNLQELAGECLIRTFSDQGVNNRDYIPSWLGC